MNSNIFISIFLVKIISLSRGENANNSCSDLQSLLERTCYPKNRLDYSENNKRLWALELQVVQIHNTLNSVNTKLDQMATSNNNNNNNHLMDSKPSLPTSCKDVQDKGHAVSGMYLIQPKYSSQQFMVLCDMETKGGGWAYFLNRFDGSQEFYLNWTHYKNGFGSLSGEFWLGLEALHQLTGYEANELLVQLRDFDGASAYALYNSFVIGNEEEGYPLKVLGIYSGNAGDSLTVEHAGMKFTTPDKDQDTCPTENCALYMRGSYWFSWCGSSNLCGKYLKGNVSTNDSWRIMFWKTFRGSSYSLKEARMMVRPRSTYSSSVLNHN